jgi:hypothetical protein
VTTKIISTYIAAGYTLSGAYSVLDIVPGGGIGGKGLLLNTPAKLVNTGFINGAGAANGVTAEAAVTIINGSVTDEGAILQGYSGVFTPGGTATVTNFATIRAHGTYGDGVFIDSGVVTNGAAGDQSAYISGDFSGVAASASARVVNFGSIKGFRADGVYLAAGGSVTNGSATDFRAEIGGSSGILTAAGAAATIVNFRTVMGYGSLGAAIHTVGGGLITNGAATDTTAKVYGVYTGVASMALATLTNFGTVVADKLEAVYLQDAGLVANGTTLDTRALIEGATGGVDFHTGVATLKNFGTIETTSSGVGVYLRSGTVTNGSTASNAALIEGIDRGVVAGRPGVSIGNFGTIDGVGSATMSGMGITLKAGGTVANGSVGDTGALIEAEGFGVSSSGFATIGNFGSIAASIGLYLSGGAKVTNGAATDTSALIFAFDDLVIRDGVGTVANFGSMIAYGTRSAVALMSGGTLTNGSAADTSALIDGGGFGVIIDTAPGAVNNFGTIEADLAASGDCGVYLAGGSVTNGSATDTAAVITGRSGVTAAAGAATTLTNFGTIRGFDGVAVYFLSPADVLNVEAGSAFQGVSQLDGGILNLAGGAGTLTGFTSAGNVTVSGSMATAKFDDFAILKIAAGASFTDTGLVNVGAGRTLTNAGTLKLGGDGTNSIVNAGQITTSGVLTLAGAVKNSGLITVAGGALTVDGAVTGAGSLTVNGGTATFLSAYTEAVTFTSKGGTLALGDSQTFTGKISGFSTTPVSVLDLEDIAFASGTTKASYSGATSSGTLTVTDGTHMAHIKLTGDYTHSTFTVASDGHGGTTVVDPTPPASRAPSLMALVAAMAALAPAGSAIPAREIGRSSVAPWLVHAA